jgi:hypothetical protein
VAADGEARACEKDAERLWLVRLPRDAVRVPRGSWKTEEGAELEAGVGEGFKAEHHAQERYRYLEERMARRGAPPPGRVMAGQRPGGRGVLWDTRVWASLE